MVNWEERGDTELLELWGSDGFGGGGWILLPPEPPNPSVGQEERGGG